MVCWASSTCVLSSSISELWVYDLRTNTHFTLKQNPLRRHHLDEFAEEIAEDLQSALDQFAAIANDLKPDR